MKKNSTVAMTPANVPVDVPAAPAKPLLTLRPAAPVQTSTAKHCIKACTLSPDRSKVLVEAGTAGTGDTAILKVIAEIVNAQPVAFLGKKGKENTVNRYFGLPFEKLSPYFQTGLEKKFGEDNAPAMWEKARANAAPEKNIVLLGIWE